MPTIEIISVNALGLHLEDKDFNFAILEEQKVESHRGLFINYLKKWKGTIIHLGNSEFIGEKVGFYNGSELINWEFDKSNITIPSADKNDHIDDFGADQTYKFQFSEKHRAGIIKILIKAINKSPNKQAFLLTDFQFGPENGKVEIIYSIKELWDLHDRVGLTFNTLYEFHGE